MEARQNGIRPTTRSGLAWATLLLSWVGLLVGCERRADLPGRQMPADNGDVLTSFYPLTYFAGQIAGGRVSVRSLCPPETDPSFWNPSRADLQQFQSASLILLNGAGYEHWATTAALPMGRVIVTSRPFEADLLTLPSIIHSHGTGGVHTHSGVDGHTWMDPVLARRQAAEILTALTQRWPADAPVFKAGFNRLSQEFDALELAFHELTPGLKSTVILTSHPAYEYLALRFGWSTTQVPLPPDEVPAPEVWEVVRKAVAAAGPGRRLMLFESDPLPVIRERLQTEWQILSVVFQTCESPPPDGNYFTRMQMNIESLRRSVGQAHP